MTDEDLFPKEPNAIWLAIFVTEFIVVFMVNAFTITAFARTQHLRKRSTYLIINLTVADLLVGAVTGPVRLYISLEVSICICLYISLENISLGIYFPHLPWMILL